VFIEEGMLCKINSQFFFGESELENQTIEFQNGATSKKSENKLDKCADWTNVQIG
jgi:hypothetical protein